MSVRPRWAIAAWLGCLVVCAFIVSRTQISTDLSAFLPRSPTPAQQILVEQLRDGVVSRLMLIGIEGGDAQALAQTSKKLAADLRGEESIAAVENGEDVGTSADREYFWRHRYLLSPAIDADHFSAPALRSALEDNLQLLGSPAGMLLQRILANDPTGEVVRLVEGLQAQARPHTQEGVWFAPDGRRALLVVQTRAAGYDIDAQERALALIRSSFAPAAAGTEQKLLATGPGVFSVSARAGIKADALRFSLLATAAIAALLLALYRSPRALVLGLVPVASGALAGVAAVSLGFGTVHGITLGFGATLIGEGVDYAIYLFTQIRPGTPPQRTLDRIWPTLRLGVLTSICGFSAMLLSGFPGLAQLGLFSISGLVVAVAVTRYVLPALLPARFAVRAAASLGPVLRGIVARARVLRYPLLVAVALAIAVLIAQRGSLWSEELASLSPVPLSEQALDKQLRRDIGAPDVRHLVFVTAADEQAALEASERIGGVLQRLSQEGALAGFDSPALYLPSRALQRTRQAALPAAQNLRASLEQALDGLPFRPGLFEPFLRDVAAAQGQPLLDRPSLQGTRLTLKLDSLLVKRGDGWAAMLPLRGVADAQAIARGLEALPSTPAVLLDLKRESDQLYQTYLREVVTYSVLGAAAITVLLFVSLRSVRGVFSVLAPLAAAVAITAGALALTGGQLTIFHLVGLLLVVAVGSNYALFFAVQAASDDEWERILVSLLFANVSTVIGFGVLAFSKVPLLNAIGTTVGTGGILCMASAAILIPRAADRRAAA